MTPLSDGQFDITINTDDGQKRVYRTLELIADSSMHGVISRGTRVWKAVLLEEGQPKGDPVVLKDCWVEPGQDPEGALYEAVIRDERALGPDTLPDTQFLTVLCHGDVLIDADHTLDCTRSFSQTDGFSDRKEAARRTGRGVKLSGRRVHYRIIFAELCQNVLEELSFSKIFRVLAHTAQGALSRIVVVCRLC